MYETYDIDSGRRIAGGYGRPVDAVDDDDACAILAAELGQYPEYVTHRATGRDFGVRQDSHELGIGQAPGEFITEGEWADFNARLDDEERAHLRSLPSLEDQC